MFHISRQVGKPWDSLTQYIRRIEQLAAIRKTQELPTETQELEGKTQELPEYTPPEGWRVLAVGEELREGDVIVHADDAMYATARAGKVVQANQRYIRPIEPQPQSELQQADTPATEYTPPEGWRALHVGEELRKGDVRVDDSGACSAVLVTVNGVVPHGRRYIRRIEAEPQPQLQPEQLADTSGRDIVRGLVLQVADLIEQEEPQPETKGEQWANIEKQADTEYTPPEGWRVLAVGERLLDGDMAVNKNCYCFPTDRVGYFVGSNKRYIRRIEPQPEPVQVREGRWRTRGGNIRDVKPTPECDNRHDRFPWRDTAYDQTWTPNGRYQFNGEDSPLDLIRYLGPIKQQLQPEPQAAAIEELRSEVSYVQRLLGESRQRVTHLEELVGSLRTINAAQEKAFNAANKANDDLQHRLNVVSKEWAEQAATSNGLRAQLDKKDAQIRDLKIELDSLQQVPADSTPMTNNDVISRSDAVDAVVLAAVEHVVAIVARLHNTQVTPELHNTIVQAIGQLTAQLPEQHDAVIPPVVAEHCDAMPTLVQSVFYNIPDAG